MDDQNTNQQGSYDNSNAAYGDSQGVGSTYDAAGQNQPNMGGGQGAMGTGVAGGYESNQQQGQQGQQDSQQQQGQQGGQQNWLDKGIQSIGQKFGHNVSQQQADEASGFAEKEASKYDGGRNIPGL